MTTYASYSTQKGSAWGSADMFCLSNLAVSTVVATADVIQALNIPAGVTVCHVVVEIATANDAGTSCTALVGDGSDPNGWDNAIDLTAAADTRTSSATGTDAYAKALSIYGYEGKTYTTADTIDLTVTLAGTAATAGAVNVYAFCTRHPML